MLHHEVRLGAEVQVIVPAKPGQYAGLWKVVKVNPRNIKLMKDGRVLNAAPAFLHRADEVVGVTQEFVPSAPRLRKGMVVVADEPRLAQRMVGHFVVTGTAGGKNQLSPLGGADDGLYWSVRAEHLRVVDVDELLGLAMAD